MEQTILNKQQKILNWRIKKHASNAERGPKEITF